MPDININIQCRICREVHSLTVDQADLDRWRDGVLIQTAMPYLTDGERELLISGTCSGCFDKLFEGGA